MGMQVAASLSMNETDHLIVAKEPRVGCLVVVGIPAVRVDEPVVVGILVVVACNLLLVGPLRICLDVRVQQTTSIAHILNSDPRADGDLERAVNTDLGSAEVRLEKGAHLGVSWTGVSEHGEVNRKAQHVDQERQDDETDDSRHDVSSKLDLGMSEGALISKHGCKYSRRAS